MESSEHNESHHDIDEQNASQDEVDQDADTKSLYEPARANTPQPLRRNPERDGRKPERYGQLEVNCITVASSNTYQIATLRRGINRAKIVAIRFIAEMLPNNSIWTGDSRNNFGKN